MPSIGDSLAESDVIFLWLRKNRGICSKISRDCNVSPAFVHMILYGQPHGISKDFVVEKALIQAGAPFVADRIAEAKPCTA